MLLCNMIAVLPAALVHAKITAGGCCPGGGDHVGGASAAAAAAAGPAGGTIDKTILL